MAKINLQQYLMRRFVVCCLSLSFVFMLLISWNTQLVAAEYMKLEVSVLHENFDIFFITKISLGAPTKTSLSLKLDMATDLVWFTCGPDSNNTMPAGDPIPASTRLDLVYNLNPASTNFSFIFCDSPLCPDDFRQYDIFNDMCNSTTLCSRPDVGSQGVIIYESMDALNTSGRDSDFIFACAPFQSNIIDTHHAAGVLGLGRGNLSFVSQLVVMYDNYFSYCLLPLDTTNSGGYFALGKANPNTNINNSTILYTPLIADPSLYLVEMTSVTMNGTRVSIDSSDSNTTLDPGTLFTTLPPEAYQAMHDIVLAMNVNTTLYNICLPSNICFNTCFNTTSSQEGAVEIPSVEIAFGGNGTTIVLDRSAVIHVVDSTVSCLGFNGRSDAYNTFGGLQLAETDVLIDLGNERVGFRPNTACASGNY